MSIRQYCRQYNRPEDNNFAAACVRDNTVDGLRMALRGSPDAVDIANWGLRDGTEWQAAIEAALADLVVDAG